MDTLFDYLYEQLKIETDYLFQINDYTYLFKIADTLLSIYIKIRYSTNTEISYIRYKCFEEYIKNCDYYSSIVNTIQMKYWFSKDKEYYELSKNMVILSINLQNAMESLNIYEGTPSISDLIKNIYLIAIEDITMCYNLSELFFNNLYYTWLEDIDKIDDTLMCICSHIKNK